MSVDLEAVLDPAQCGVVIVDLQNDYCHPDGALAQKGSAVSTAMAAAKCTVDLLAAAHDANVPCIHVRTEHSDWTDTPAWTMRGRSGDRIDAATFPIVAPGTWGAQPYEIQTSPQDRVITKHRYSGFAFTSLELSLRARGCESFVLAGVTSDICVRATAVSGLMLGFTPILVSDCTASATEEVHQTAIKDFVTSIGPVVDLATVEKKWSASSR